MGHQLPLPESFDDWWTVEWVSELKRVLSECNSYQFIDARKLSVGFLKHRLHLFIGEILGFYDCPTSYVLGLNVLKELQEADILWELSLDMDQELIIFIVGARDLLEAWSLCCGLGDLLLHHQRSVVWGVDRLAVYGFQLELVFWLVLLDHALRHSSDPYPRLILAVSAPDAVGAIRYLPWGIHPTGWLRLSPTVRWPLLLFDRCTVLSISWSRNIFRPILVV